MTSFADEQWNKQYEKLVEFKRKNGHCLVPRRYHQEDMSLGEWVSKQRGRHANNTMRQDRKEVLDEIGFVWKALGVANNNNYNKTWHQQYQKLVEFKRKNGHCLVPIRYEKDLSLGKWVGKQRFNHCKNKLPLERKGLLDEIGFVWKAPGVATNNKNNDKNWHQQYEKLVEFKRKNRHCNVPRGYQEDSLSLGIWVKNQRQFHKRNKLRLDRKGLLEEIGFVWKARNLAARSSTTDVSYR
jgi:hypothetical protein